MNDLLRNFGAFLIGLGMQPPVSRTGLPCPAYVAEQKYVPGSAMIETREEVAAHIDLNRGVAGRAFPHRAMGAIQV
jgi:hypothetical protein